MQVSPPVPQWSMAEVSQVLPLQHPPAQLVLSHAHWWDPLQSCPAAHSAAEPQVQSPPTQLSARRVSQAAHAAPPLPQCCLLTDASATHVAPSQQPSQPLWGSQTQVPPVPHRWPAAHGAGVAAAPHEQVPATQLSALVASHEAQAPPPVPHRSVL
jgi:hypothetical protein